MVFVAPGEYAIRFQLIDAQGNGKANYYDAIIDAGHFIITEDPEKNQGFVWNEPVWGNMRLNPLELDD